MRVMVTGGAGYIGSHVAHLLAERGDYVVVADDLSAGSLARVSALPLVRVDLASDGADEMIAGALREHSIEAVIHFAARKHVGESVERPAWYYRQNVGGLAQLLSGMERAGVGTLVFSSSAAVYGDAQGEIDESHPTSPVNPYGATKLAGEQLIEAATRAWPLRAASLRYFNVAGAGRPELADRQAFNLVPIVLDHLAQGEAPVIFGDDYDTADGTCVRDYVHVSDVAEAHLAALTSLSDRQGHTVLNVGTGVGTSVREMIAAISAVAETSIQPTVRGRRVGDPAAVVAIVDRIEAMTGWRARLSLDDIVRSAWISRSSAAPSSPPT